MAFTRSDAEQMDNKNITLIDNAYANTMTYLANVKRYQERNGVYYPVNKLLEVNLSSNVHEVSLNLFNDDRYSEQRVTYLNKALERVS